MKIPQFIGVIIILFVIVGSADAVGNIHLGRVEFHPILGTRGIFTDNLYQKSDEKLSNFLTENKLGLSIFWPGNVHLLSLDYGANLFTFSELRNYDKNIFFKNGLNLLFDLNFPGGIYTRLNELYLETLSPASGEDAGVVERTENTANAGIGYKSGDRFNLSLGYMNVFHDYKLDIYNTLDRMEQSVGPDIYLKILSKTSLLLDYKYRMIGYKYLRDGISRDSTQHDIMLGVTGKLTSKLSYELKAGLESRKYKESLLKGFSTPVAGLSLILQPSALWGLDLKFFRRAYESNWGQNYYFIQNRADLRVNWYTTRKLTTNLSAGYELNQYSKEELNSGTGTMEKRQDGILQAELSIAYDIKTWFKAVIGYSLRSRSSNFDIWDYSENRISLAIHLVL